MEKEKNIHDKENQKRGNKDECPLCQISEETIKKLKNVAEEKREDKSEETKEKKRGVTQERINNFFAKIKNNPWLFFALALIILSGFFFNQFFQIEIRPKKSLFGKEKVGILISPEKKLTEKELQVARAYLKFNEIKSQVIPTGIPETYGQALGISFEEVQEAINKVAPLDPTYGSQKITLEGSELERYIKIGKLTSCRYCCGAQTLVFEDGEAACGCEHSQMMRGLSAHLIKNYPQFSDEKILEELNKWRATFFPKQTLQEVLSEKEKAGEEGIKELLKEFPEFLPEMVGGC